MEPTIRIDEYAAPISTEIEEVTFTCYDNNLLLHLVESELERQYENIYSSIAQFRVAGVIRNTSTLIIRKGNRIMSVLLFQREKNRVTVMNEVIKIGNDAILRFAHYIFTSYKSVTVISFHAVQTDIQRLPFPFQRFNYSEDIVVTLPRTEQDYLASLGKATRKNMIRHRNRLMRNFPSFCRRAYAGEEVEERYIREIVNLNRARMAGKNKVSAYDEQGVQRLATLARTHGLLCVATIDGRICAGSICFRVGAKYFMEVNAHDPAYDDYRLGTLCCYLTICESISRGGSEFHLLWGRYEYKYMLLGVQRDLDNLVIYRSHAQMLFNGGLVMKSALQGYIRLARLGIHNYNAGHRDAFIFRFARKCVNCLRNLRQFRLHLFETQK